MNSFYVSVEVNPADLAANLRYRDNRVMPPRPRAAQDAIITAVKQAAIDRDLSWVEEVEMVRVTMDLGFLNRRGDLDGPIKRIIDGIERGLKAQGIRWNDNRVYDLFVRRYLSTRGMVTIKVEDMEDGPHGLYGGTSP